jgi:hypothetical protein
VLQGREAKESEARRVALLQQWVRGDVATDGVRDALAASMAA